MEAIGKCGIKPSGVSRKVAGSEALSQLIVHSGSSWIWAIRSRWAWVQITEFSDEGRMTSDQYPPTGDPIEAVVLGHTDEHRKQIWLGMKPSQFRGDD